MNILHKIFLSRTGQALVQAFEQVPAGDASRSLLDIADRWRNLATNPFDKLMVKHCMKRDLRADTTTKVFEGLSNGFKDEESDPFSALPSFHQMIASQRAQAMASQAATMQGATGQQYQVVDHDDNNEGSNPD